MYLENRRWLYECSIESIGMYRDRIHSDIINQKRNEYCELVITAVKKQWFKLI